MPSDLNALPLYERVKFEGIPEDIQQLEQRARLERMAESQALACAMSQVRRPGRRCTRQER